MQQRLHSAHLGTLCSLSRGVADVQDGASGSSKLLAAGRKVRSLHRSPLGGRITATTQAPTVTSGGPLTRALGPDECPHAVLEPGGGVQDVPCSEIPGQQHSSSTVAARGGSGTDL